ncbi:MAG: NUDIX domain-containing protein [Chthonomonadales bacterium]|nr:NUDIX domain-containing protein [Chthonomonadales bacterium]
MPLVSAGMLPYRVREGLLEVLLAHPGGPIYAHRDAGWWSIPKGLPNRGEPLLDAAIRELREEVGMVAERPFLKLGWVRQRGGKVVHAWACNGDLPDGPLPSNTFHIQWPPLSGNWIVAPEVDRAAFFGLKEARVRIGVAQAAFLDRLEGALGRGTRAQA